MHSSQRHLIHFPPRAACQAALGVVLAAALAGCCSCPGGSAAPPPGGELAPGESVVVPVDSRVCYNPTGVRLADRGVYEFEVEGDQCWCDWFIPCTAAGYDRFWIHWARGLQRHPGANYFALIGSVDRDPDRQFVIGTRARYTAGGGGELFCFANDVPFMYWNNCGTVQLTIRRLR